MLLDVRSPELFAAGHVPGAVNLPHGQDECFDVPEGAMTFLVAGEERVVAAGEHTDLPRFRLDPGPFVES